MDEPTADPTEPVDPGTTADDLARRIRGALDDRVAPVTLEEVRALARRADRAGAPAPPSSVDPDPADDADPQPEAGPPILRRLIGDGLPSGSAEDPVDPVVVERTDVDRRRSNGPPVTSRASSWTRVLAAAAIVLVLVGVGVALLRPRSTVVETVVPADLPVGAATGGIFDPRGTLATKRVSATTASDSGLLFLGYVDLRDDSGGVAEDSAGVQAEELVNQADALGEEVRSIEEEMAAADPTSPAVEVLRQEAAGLRERQADLMLEARGMTSSPDRRGPVYGLLVADAGNGAVIADHPLPERVRAGSLVAIGSTLWFTTSVGGGPDSLWRSADRGAPELIEALPGRAELAGDAGSLWLRGTDVLQRRDPTSGAVVEAAETGAAPAFAGYGAIATGEAGTFTVVGTDQIVAVQAMLPGPTLPVDTGDLAVRRLRVAGPSLFVVDGAEVIRVDGATGQSLGRESFGLQILGIDSRGGRFWAAGEDEDPSTALVQVTVIDGSSGERRVTQVAMVGESPQVAALGDTDAVLCVSSIQTGAAPPPAPPALGSECRRVSSPFATDGPPPTAGTTATTALAPGTISFDGVGPIRFSMTPADVAAVGLGVAPVEPSCGPGAFPVTGLPEGVRVVFGGDDRVRAVVVATPAVATIDGIRTGSSIDEVLALHPAAEVFAREGIMQYMITSDDRQRSVLFRVEDSIVTSIVAAMGSDGLLDVCGG